MGKTKRTTATKLRRGDNVENLEASLSWMVPGPVSSPTPLWEWCKDVSQARRCSDKRLIRARDWLEDEGRGREHGQQTGLGTGQAGRDFQRVSQRNTALSTSSFYGSGIDFCAAHTLNHKIINVYYFEPLDLW